MLVKIITFKMKLMGLVNGQTDTYKGRVSFLFSTVYIALWPLCSTAATTTTTDCMLNNYTPGAYLSLFGQSN